MNALLEKNLEALKLLCTKYNVRYMYAFGSVCTSGFNDESDVDLLISFNNLSIEDYTESFFALHYQLQDLLKRDIDLLTDRSLGNPYFIEGIERNKQLIYAA
jgi:hypothetical protein